MSVKVSGLVLNLECDTNKRFSELVWEDALKFSKDCFAGASAAVVAKTVIAPVERVKLILQVSP